MRAKDFLPEATIGTNPKRPARAGSRPDRGHEPKPRYVTDRKTGKQYDPEEEFDKLKNSDDFKAQMKRMATKEGAPIVVAQAPIDVRNPKKAPQPYRNKGDIVPDTKPSSTEKRGVKGRPGQRPMPKYDEQFCEECGGSLAEEGKASRALCSSSKPDNELGASQLASCKSQGLRARDGEKSHLIGHGNSSVRVTVGGKKIKGKKYGGPLPDYGTRKNQR
jgi:hypothetical protein